MLTLALVALAGGAALVGCGGSSPGGSSPKSSSPARTPASASTRAAVKAPAVKAAVPAGQQGTAAAASGHGGEREAVPILMYHVINPPPANAKFPGLYVSRQELEGQVRALTGAGFHAVTMDQVWEAWRHGGSLPRKPIVLSFDNGYQSQYTNALPVLRSVGWVGVENIQLTGLPPSQGGMSQAQVRGLVSAGWELDTQGISHADLIALSSSALHEQVAVAREEVKRRYRVPVNWFCYPSGHYNATVVAEVKAAGYVGSTTVVPGLATSADDPYRLPRLRVLGGTSPSALLAQITIARGASPAPPSYP